MSVLLQVDGWCGKDLVEQAGWNLQYRPDSRAEWRRAVNKVGIKQARVDPSCGIVLYLEG